MEIQINMPAVRGLFLSVPQGECFGMLGPNGAGKTSFINMVSKNGSTDMCIEICLSCLS